MAEWSKKKVTPEQLNNGQEYTIDDQLAIEALNAIVNNSFYLQENASNIPNKQDTLVSGVNIKTINGQSLLGSGNIQIDVPDDLLDRIDAIEEKNKVQDESIETNRQSIISLNEAVQSNTSSITDLQNQIDNLDLSPEQVGQIKKDINDIKNTTIPDIQGKLSADRQDITDLTSSLNDYKTEVNSTLEDYDKRITQNANDISGQANLISQNTSKIQGNTNEIEKIKADIEALDISPQEIQDLKTQVSEATTKVGELDTKVDGFDERITANKNATEKNAGDIATNAQNISKNADDIATNKANIENNTQAIGENSAAIVTINERIDNLSISAEEIEALKQDVSDLSDEIPQIKADIQTNATNIQSNKSSIDTNTSDIASLKTSDSTQNSEIASLKSTLETHENTLTTHTGQIEDIQNQLANLDISAEEIEALQQSVADIPQMKTDIQKNKDDILVDKQNIAKNSSTLESHETLISDNTTAIGDNKKAIDENTKGISDLNTRLDNLDISPEEIEGLKTKVGEFETELNTLQTSVTQNTANIAENTSDINTNKSNIATNTQNISDNTEKISNNSTKIAQNENAISALQTTISGKQDTLVSGTNIKTINGESVLGEGNIQIEGIQSDDELSLESENSVQNKVVTAALNDKVSLTKDELILGQKVFEKIPYIRLTLPIEYSHVEYIQRTTTQYIEIPYKPNQDTKVEIKILTNNIPSSTTINNCVFGSGKGYNVDRFAFFAVAGGYASYGSSHNENSGLSANTEYIITQDKNIFYIDGEVTKTFTYSQFESPYNLLIGAVRQSDGIHVSNSGYNLNIYYCKIYENDELLYDLVPCYRKSDGEIGLFDIKNQVFYTNAGSGVFAKPENVINGERLALHSEIEKAVNDRVSLTKDEYIEGEKFFYKVPKVQIGGLPKGYTELEYIESTGTQYIDTGVKLNQDSVVELDVNFLDTNQANIFGSRTSSHSSQYAIFRSPSYVRIGLGDSYWTMDTDPTDRIFIKITKNIINFGSEIKNPNYTGSFTTPSNAYIFYISYNQPQGTAKPNMRLYSCKIFDGEELVRDFVPCQKDDTGEVGLYDMVTEQFFKNSGAGTFIAGNVVEESTVLSYVNLATMNDLDEVKEEIKNISTSGIEANPIDPATTELKKLKINDVIYGIPTTSGGGGGGDIDTNKVPRPQFIVISGDTIEDIGGVGTTYSIPLVNIAATSTNILEKNVTDYVQFSTNKATYWGRIISKDENNANIKVDFEAVTKGNLTISPDGIAHTDGNDFVIESWMASDGNTWYRKYASGWKECGGTLESVPKDTTSTITFPLTFDTIKYQIFLQALGGKRNNTQYTNGHSVQEKNLDSCIINVQDYTFGRDWFAKGY